MRIAIIDDKETDREYLQQMITSCFQEAGFPIGQTECFESGKEFLLHFKPGTYDMIFLDIYMNGINGIETAEQIRSQDSYTKLIFISISNDFASESYAVHADYYLLKSYEKKDFFRIFTRLNLTDFRKKRMVTLPGGRQILLHNILYTSFLGHYVTINQACAPALRIRCTQKDFEACLLPYPDFITCTRGMIVNLNEVSCLNSDHFVMNNGEHVPISRRRYPEIKQTYSDFLIAKIRREEPS